jgi:hypothetical protein
VEENRHVGLIDVRDDDVVETHHVGLIVYNQQMNRVLESSLVVVDQSPATVVQWAGCDGLVVDTSASYLTSSVCKTWLADSFFFN